MKFIVRIDLGNASMVTGEHVQNALIQVARNVGKNYLGSNLVGMNGVDRLDCEGPIRDANGNRVGTWELEE